MVERLFSKDWVNTKPDQWRAPLEDLAPRVAIETGAWEGRSACWFLDHLPSLAELHCVDPYRLGQEVLACERNFLHDRVKAERRFRHNTAPFRDRVVLHRESSVAFFLKWDMVVDFVYVDGAHHSAYAFHDIVAAWRCVRAGGLVIVDDYDWPGDGDYPVLGACKLFEAEVSPEIVSEGRVVIYRR